MRFPKKGKFPALEKAGFLLPKKVSTNINNAIEKIKQQQHGTKAFMPVGTEFNHPFSRNAYLAGVYKANQLRELAQKSNYFIKNYSIRQQLIAKKLQAAGIKTEIPTLVSKNRMAVFEKCGHSLSSNKGMALFRKNFRSNLETIERMVAKMHSLGISHNHLHAGNITIDEKGTIRIIDLGKATIIDLSKIKKPVEGFLQGKFKSDLLQVSHSLTLVGASKSNGLKFRDKIIGNIISHYPKELIAKIHAEDLHWLASWT